MLIRSSVVLFLGKIISAVSGLLASMIIVYYLGAEGQGIYQLFLTSILTAAVFGNLGITLANTFFAGKRRECIPILWRNSVVLALVIGMLSASIGGWLKEWDTAIGDQISWVYGIVVVCSISLVMLRQFGSGILLGAGLYTDFTLVETLPALGFLLWLPLLLHIQPSDESVIIAYSLGSLMSIILLRSCLGRYTRMKTHSSAECFGIGVHLKQFKQSLKFGLKGQIGNIFQFLNYRLDIFVLTYYWGPEKVGIYSIAVLLAEAIWRISDSIAAVVFSRIAGNDNSHGDHKDADTEQAVRIAVFFSLLAGGVIWLIGSCCVTWVYGSKFDDVMNLFGIMLPGIVGLSAGKVLAGFIVGNGNPERNSIVAFLALTITITLNIMLVPKFGYYGAAVASMVAYLAATIILVLYYRRVRDVSFRRLLILTASDIEAFRAAVGR